MKTKYFTYIAGFILSLALTVTAFTLTSQHTLSQGALVTWLISLALAQLAVQLVFFLHLGHEQRPRWSLVAFGSMLVVLAILVFGSLWIMSNLNYHMTTPSDQSIMQDEGIQH